MTQSYHCEDTRSLASDDTEEPTELILNLEGADFAQNRFLIFEDQRIEELFRASQKDRKTQLSVLMAFSFLLLAIIEWLVTAHRSYFAEDIAERIIAWGRIVWLSVILGSFLGLLYLRRIDSEVFVCICVYGTPPFVHINNTYRMSKLFDTDYYVRKFGGAYDDSTLVFCLFAALSVPLMVSLQVRKAVLLVPEITVLYVLFALASDIEITEVLVNTILLVIVGLLLYFSLYRAESQSRQKWKIECQLKIKMSSQRRELERQRDWLTEVQDRVDAFSSFTGDIAGHLLTQSSSAPTEAHMSSSGPAKDIDAEAAAAAAAAAMISATVNWGKVPSAPVPDIQPLTLGTPGERCPNETTFAAMYGRSADTQILRKMALRFTDFNYGARELFEDAIRAFPELSLYEMDMGNGPLEYQRTMGALFALYSIARLDGDGKHTFCFGYKTSTWQSRVRAKSSESRMTRNQRKAFLNDMDWDCFAKVYREAIQGSVERLEAMLALTAFHDIMKLESLTPQVQPEHAPFYGIPAGNVILDHDLALAYMLEHYPNALPSYRALPKASQELVLFTQGKLNFNHGWFVQAEAPPGITLTKFKEALKVANAADLAFYFLHWLTDLSGAEGRPLAGSEKFVLKFPRAVLHSFLWSIPYLQQLVHQSETEVFQSYLVARWEDALDEELPCGPHEIAVMRLVVMAQSAGHLVLNAFLRLPPGMQEVLVTELARTGISDQFYDNPKSLVGGPALFIYYGPALLQCCTKEDDMREALRALAAVYHSARKLWPLRDEDADVTVSLEAGCLKSFATDFIRGYSVGASLSGKMLVLERKNPREGVVSMIMGCTLNEMLPDSWPMRAVDTSDPVFTTAQTAYVVNFVGDTRTSFCC